LSRQTFLLSEFLESKAPNFPLPRLERKALMHGHCHHKSIMKMTAEESVLRRLGIDFQSPAPGCCGMAGSFGFEHDKYDISMAIGELELLPAVRHAPADWLIIADGFSCREQIAQGSNRHALHLAEVLKMALREARDTGSVPFPESSRARQREADLHSSMTRVGLGL
jgi:Fe-S oxidoreductase